jgi:hypothetical protein
MSDAVSLPEQLERLGHALNARELGQTSRLIAYHRVQTCESEPDS